MGGAAEVIDQVFGKGLQNLSNVADKLGFDKSGSDKSGTGTAEDDKALKKKKPTKKSARAALVAGGATGVESSLSTSGRGTLLGN